MAEPLKNQFGAEVPKRIGAAIQRAHAGFAAAPFVRDVLEGFEALELMPRGRKIAVALHRHLPPDYPQAIAILLASLTTDDADDAPLPPFFYMPHCFFVAQFGLEHFELSMNAQYELTQRFTAEFSIRPFIERYPEATLTRLQAWARDDSEHVRRLVSEGTRTRLPWAPRLPGFQKDPRPVLALLELLKDDPALYVRRSVANNLNDIGKDHPALLLDTVRRWQEEPGTSPERRWLIRHALRSAVKRADPAVLELMGVGGEANVSVTAVCIEPNQPTIGESVEISFDLTNLLATPQNVLVDLRVHFVKANGKTSAKVFKLKELALGAETVRLRKKISLKEMTTRRHYAGSHPIDVVINGRTRPIGDFSLVEAPRAGTHTRQMV